MDLSTSSCTLNGKPHSKYGLIVNAVFFLRTSTFYVPSPCADTCFLLARPKCTALLHCSPSYCTYNGTPHIKFVLNAKVTFFAHVYLFYVPSPCKDTCFLRARPKCAAPFLCSPSCNTRITDERDRRELPMSPTVSWFGFAEMYNLCVFIFVCKCEQ